MTDRPAPALYVSDEELYTLLGLDKRDGACAVQAMEMDRSFPKKEPLFGNKRYWPAVRAFFDRRYGLSMTAPAKPDIKGALDAPADRSRTGPALATPEGRHLHRRLART